MAEGEPARNDRQDLFVFLGVVAICLTLVAAIAITKGDWNATQWTALGAIAAVLQTVTLIVALAPRMAADPGDTRSSRPRANAASCWMNSTGLNVDYHAPSARSDGDGKGSRSGLTDTSQTRRQTNFVRLVMRRSDNASHRAWRIGSKRQRKVSRC